MASLVRWHSSSDSRTRVISSQTSDSNLLGRLLHDGQPGRHPCRHSAGDVADVVVAVALEERGGDGAAVAGAADHRDRTVLGYLFIAVLHHPAVDVSGAVDVAGGPFAAGADVEDERP